MRRQLEELPEGNSAKLEKLLELVERIAINREDWTDTNEHMRPTSEDLISRLVDYGHASSRAGSHGKRRILWSAFFSTFKPEFYKEGMSNHPWRIATQIEYPECELLARCVAEGEEKNGWVATKRRHLAGGTVGALDEFFLVRLETLGLVARRGSSSDQMWIVTQLGLRFREFVWDEFMESQAPQ